MPTKLTSSHIIHNTEHKLSAHIMIVRDYNHTHTCMLSAPVYSCLCLHRSQQQTADAIDTMDSAPAVPAAPKEEVLPRENAVLVLGATGRLGRRVVKQV